MRDLFFIAFLASIFGLGLRRPFILVLVYSYIDIVSPQRLSYYLLNSIPISLISFAAVLVTWLIFDDKKDCRLSRRQGVMALLLVYCWWTTLHADFPVQAATKWDWVWKALLFAMFLPLTLRTKLRIEALALMMVLCAGTIIVTGGIKTALGGGGYGELNLMVENNSGLYEGSIISTVAIAIIPLILYLSNYGTIFPPDWRVKLFAYAFCFACLLIPIGTEARTGLICAAVLAGMMWWQTKRRVLYAGIGAVALLAAIPFLPASFTERMNTIQTYQGDESASTRLQVWKWTLDYVSQHPMGGGFDNYLANSFTYNTIQKTGPKDNQRVEHVVVTDRGRAFHSSYFEMLGEQGYPGLIIWLVLNIGTLVQSERLRRRYKDTDNPDYRWVAPFAQAMVQGHVCYLIGCFFVGIAYQPFVFMLIALQIAATTYMRRKRASEDWRPIAASKVAPATG
ncbi:putative O-glycosylation ligase, exosortase A system-associated [Sphingobium nicotianae]|uniref:O-glycosylation ligase, exosortase A system-associated n=1 Tax=Sphingobium nicotianae TaxID=2782607 RepID=A0A9X1DF96_9SPHN|nr:putative O-glycosylation ligase, exosortase A system-associated [Sphingobium nicotianae]MBT2188824.1 putative O-glycosylation ligase, exosortase A system-associated [Sphingobium nicotianae]